MQRRALITSPRDARLAVTQERTEQEAPEKCSMQFALSAAKNAKFLSIPPRARLFIAASALQQEERSNFRSIVHKKDTDFGVFFLFLSARFSCLFRQKVLDFIAGL
jgi:hypothetical protein